MYELIIDTQEDSWTMFLSSYEEVDSVVQNLEEGSFWEVRSYPDCAAITEGMTW